MVSANLADDNRWKLIHDHAAKFQQLEWAPVQARSRLPIKHGPPIGHQDRQSGDQKNRRRQEQQERTEGNINQASRHFFNSRTRAWISPSGSNVSRDFQGERYSSSAVARPPWVKSTVVGAVLLRLSAGMAVMSAPSSRLC